MREPATLRLDNGDEIRVEVDTEELARDEIVVRRAPVEQPAAADLVSTLRAHLETAERHPDGTTDRLLRPDRDRPY